MEAFPIEHDAPEPPYRQLAALLRARIESGEYPAGRRLPSETDIHQATGLARTTIRRAIAVLVAEGLVTVVPRRGTYVAERRRRGQGRASQ